MEVEPPLWGTLPHEMTKNIIRYLDVPALFSLSSTCRQFQINLDQDARLWQLIAVQRYGPMLRPSGVPQFCTRRHLALLERDRHCLLLAQIRPLQDGSPCVVSRYFQIFDCLRQLEARDFVEKTLASLQIICHAKVGVARNSSFSPSPSHPAAGWAASVEVTLALHLIYRSVREGTALGPWLEGVLRRLSQGPYLGTLVVAYWVLGSHNPYGFRARDVLKTEKVDLREVSELILETERVRWAAMGSGGWVVGKGLPLYSVKPDHRLAKVVEALQRLETLRDMLPPAILDPATVYITQDHGSEHCARWFNHRKV